MSHIRESVKQTTLGGIAPQARIQSCEIKREFDCRGCGAGKRCILTFLRIKDSQGGALHALQRQAAKKSAEVTYSIRMDHRDSTRCSDVLSVLRSPTIARIYRQCRITVYIVLQLREVRNSRPLELCNKNELFANIQTLVHLMALV